MMNLSKAKSLSEMFANREICEEYNDLPSMVLPCHNLTVQQIFEDYCRGVIHTSGPQGIYDTDELNAEPTETEDIEPQDILNVFSNHPKDVIKTSSPKGDDTIGSPKSEMSEEESSKAD